MTFSVETSVGRHVSNMLMVMNLAWAQPGFLPCFLLSEMSMSPVLVKHKSNKDIEISDSGDMWLNINFFVIKATTKKFIVGQLTRHC